MKRIFFDLFLFLSVFIFPWWVSAIFILIGVFIFDNFYEFIFVCIVVYAIYSAPSHGLFSSSIFFSSFISVLYIVIQLFKNNLIFYKK